MLLITFLLGGYLIGGFPSAVLIAKFKGKDVFKVGSSNMGAMNIARNLSYGLGILVLVLDIGKGALAAYLGSLYSQETALVASLGVVLGHLWSPYINFRGGKALSTTFGAALILYPFVAIIMLVIIILSNLLKNKLTATILALAFYPLLVILTNKDLTTIIVTVLIAFFIIIKHLIPNQHSPQIKE